MIRYENKIPVDDYLRLREAAGWKKIARKQAENAVSKCFYSVCVWDDDKVIGMMRILWNGDYCCKKLAFTSLTGGHHRHR